MNITTLIENWAKAQNAGANLPCPRCGNHNMRVPSTHNCLSRRADVYVCEHCGAVEALEDSLTPRHLRDDAASLNSWYIAVHLRDCAQVKQEGEIYLLEARTRIRISPQTIDDIMCTALEGGINYWCGCAEVVEEEEVDGTTRKKYLGDYASDQISRGGSLRLHDKESGETEVLTLDKFLDGIKIAVEKGYANGWLCDGYVNPYYVDASDADKILQFAIFGDITYA